MVAITVRIWAACCSALPCRLRRLIAATVICTASPIALSAQARPCWRCICSANSAMRFCSSSGSPNRFSQPAIDATLTTMVKVEGAGVALAYEASGEGPAVVLVHGMAADRTAWPDGLGGARVIAYDRRGYGESEAPEPYARTTVAEQAEDLAAVVRELDAAPALAVGADFGALVVLDVLKRHAGLVRVAVLIDPPVFQLVPAALEPLAAERLMLEEALREGGRERAVEAWLAKRGRADGERLARAQRDVVAFFADYGGQATLPLSRRDLRGLEVPVAVLDSAGAPAHARAASDAVARLVPGARRDAGDLLAVVSALL